MQSIRPFFVLAILLFLVLAAVPRRVDPASPSAAGPSWTRRADPRAANPPTPVAELEGRLRPARVVAVTAPMEGVLATVLVERGDFVRAGELLAELDLTVEQAEAELARIRSRGRAEVKAAEIRLLRLEAKLRDHEALHEEGILMTEDLRETRTERELAEYAVEEAKEHRLVAEYEWRRARSIVERGRIKSPLAGVVLERPLSPGELATRALDRPVARVAQLDPLVVETRLDGALFGRLREGQLVEALLDGPLEGTRSGRIAVLDRVLDADGRFGVRIEIPNQDYTLPAGLACRLRILP